MKSIEVTSNSGTTTAAQVGRFRPAIAFVAVLLASTIPNNINATTNTAHNMRSSSTATQYQQQQHQHQPQCFVRYTPATASRRRSTICSPFGRRLFSRLSTGANEEVALHAYRPAVGGGTAARNGRWFERPSRGRRRCRGTVACTAASTVDSEGSAAPTDGLFERSGGVGSHDTGGYTAAVSPETEEQHCNRTHTAALMGIALELPAELWLFLTGTEAFELSNYPDLSALVHKRRAGLFKSLFGIHKRSNTGHAAERRDNQGQLASRDLEAGLKIPRHVAFVMDGNGRWAAERRMPRTAGHIEGARRAAEAVEACRALGVEYVTLYAFSTENWNRPKSEVSFLMNLMEKTLLEQRDGLRRGGIRLTAIGELQRLPPRLRTLLQDMQQETHQETPAVPGTGVKNGEVCGSPASSCNGSAGHIGDKILVNGRKSETLSLLKDKVPATDSMPGPVTPRAGSGTAHVRNGSRRDKQQCLPNSTVTDNDRKLTHAEHGAIDGLEPKEQDQMFHSHTPLRSRQSASSNPTSKTMTLCLAISYGGRAEVAAAARELAAEVAAGRLEPADITEEALGRCLSTARLGIPDPDLVVRTSGESRLSNLLLWQAAYTELYVVGKAWPEFRRPDLIEAFREFGSRRRRFGRTPEQAAEA